MEKVTLHFNLSHLPTSHEYELKACGSQLRLTLHDEESRRHYAGKNSAVALLVAGGNGAQLTHFVEDVELPSDAVSFNWVGYPSSRPGAVADEIGVVFQYVPRAAVQRALTAMQRDGQLKDPTRLAHLGLTSVADHPDPVRLHLDADVFIDLRDTALTMLMQHPEIGTLDPTTCSRIKSLLKNKSSFTRLVNYLSAHPPTAGEPWYENTYVKDPDGNVMVPADDLLDSKGETVQWPTLEETSTPVIPQYLLSDGLDEALTPAVKEAATLIKQQSFLKGRQWNTLHGVTELSRTGVAPTLQTQLSANSTAAQAQWTIANKTAMYGLDVYQDSMEFDATTNTMTFKVKNWPNRALGAYVQFLDASDAPVDNPDGWQERLPKVLRTTFQPSASKKFLNTIVAGSTFFGIPVWAPRLPISFAVPEGATGARVLIGGLGHGACDWDVDKMGVILTSCVSYGIPSLLSVMSVGIQSTQWYQDYFADPENVEEFIQIAMVPCSCLFAGGMVTIGIEATLIKVAKFVAGILLSKALKALATKITVYMTGQQVVQQAPFIGWALKVASQACAIAEMIGTSIEVGLSPATYAVELKRSMSLTVTVNPDPTHGTATEKPIWPKQSSHYVIQVQYAGGTTLTKTGPMPGSASAPIEVRYSADSGDALPSAPGQKFQIIATVYAADDTLCGRWVSGWIEAVPTDGSNRSESGSIIEQLVPLTGSTRYTHDSMLRYDGKYTWQKTTNPPSPVDLSGQGVKELVDLTINNLAAKLGYCYRADKQNLPLDNGTGNEAGDMYVFRSISTLTDPGKGMLAPSRGFSAQPCIAFDQFGPAGLFTIDPAQSYQTDLDKGGAAPESVRNVFASNGFPLSDGSQVRVLKAGTSWQIGLPGQDARFDLRRHTDVITVFTAPVPEFSPNNFYLDTRTYRAGGVSHLRLVDLSDSTATTFDYSGTNSWGAFAMSNINATAIHPNGYAIAISFKDNKMAIVELPAEGVADKDAPQALPFCGTGQREGLLQGPVAMTITADGRILVLEQKNARIQAFDTYANPVQCFKAELSFTLAQDFIGDLNSGNASTALLQALQRNVPVKKANPIGDPRYLLTPAFSMEGSFAETLNAGVVTQALSEQFTANALTLEAAAEILQTSKGLWLVRNPASGLNFDIRDNGESTQSLDVYRCFTPVVMVESPNSEWRVLDKTNTLSFKVTATDDGTLKWTNMTALMGLKDSQDAPVTYLDVAVEAKGFIYVLSYLNEGKSPSDYRLDIYKPDGTPLTTDRGVRNGQVAGARMMVDQWRTLFTLNYQQMQGVAGRPEPTVSQWIPSR